MKKAILIRPKNQHFVLRSITSEDIEFLRILKNRHKESFFFQEEISSNMQIKWFQKYALREDDHIMIVDELRKERYVSVGCIGFRVIGGVIDIYNVIKDIKLVGVKTKMSAAISALCLYLQKNYHKPISTNVLKSNPALIWYLKHGFEISEDKGDYFMILWKGI